MNNLEHKAFIFFNRNYSKGIAAVFTDLYHWGTIEWKGHKAGDWFYKSIRNISEEVGVMKSTAERAYKLIKEGHCNVFESKVDKQKNYKITYLRVVTRNNELSTIHCPEKEDGVSLKTGQHCPQNRDGITIETHNKLQEGDLIFEFSEHYFSTLLSHLFRDLAEGIEVSLCTTPQEVYIWQPHNWKRGKLYTLVSQHEKIIALRKEHHFIIDIKLNKEGATS